MAKPITEHRTNVKAKGRGKKSPEPEYEGGLQPVHGGRVRRIVFEGREEAPEEVEFTPVRSEYMPRHDASMDEIEFEVDNIHRRRHGRPPLPSSFKGRTRTRDIYTTDRGGAVREAYRPSRSGEKRVLYTTVDRGTHTEERRFSSALVDKIIAGVDLEPEVEVHRQTKTTIIKRKKKVVQKVPVGEHQPQCEALTKDHKQCRNSAKAGSTFCGSHQGYKAMEFEKVIDAKDTAPRHKSAENTKPGTKGASATHQCAAYTKDGLQCKNSSRKSSKYCGSHKGYRPPTKAQLLKQMDTKPRHNKAKDTAPKLK